MYRLLIFISTGKSEDDADVFPLLFCHLRTFCSDEVLTERTLVLFTEAGGKPGHYRHCHILRFFKRTFSNEKFWLKKKSILNL